ncbi:MAG: hypothetical protein AMXMBFR12_00850 [Candidatus Babeliales bacterium]
MNKTPLFFSIISIFSITGFIYFFWPRSCQLSTAEIRAYISDVNTTRNALEGLGATLKSDYAFTDYIYQPNDRHVDLSKEFIRLRVYEKTAWKQKNYVLVHKLKGPAGMTGQTPIHKEFDTLAEAQHALKDNYHLDFQFYRKGWEYQFSAMKIFVEDVQNIRPTIEVVTPNKKDIDSLFEKLGLTEIITDSVPRLIEKQKK